MIQRLFYFVLLSFLGLAFAHDWAELKSVELTGQMLEQLISIAEQEQAALTAKLEPLNVGATALDWLEWLENALLLYTYEGQSAFEQRLLEANYQTEERDSVLFWQHDMAQLAQVYDASFASFDQVALSVELETLNPAENPELYARASQLSYQLTLSSVSETDKARLEPFLPRLSQLIERAGDAQ
jgi:hypothetical protein